MRPALEPGGGNVAKQPRFNPATNFQGPFLGLNTVRSKAELPAQFATIARNVLFTDGRLQPHPPWDPWAVIVGLELPRTLPRPQENTGKPFSLYVWPQHGGLERRRVIVNGRGGMWAIDEFAGLVFLGGDDALKAPCDYVSDGNVLYVLTGTVPWRTEGTLESTRPMGFKPPPPHSVLVFNNDAAPGDGGTGSVDLNADWAVTVSTVDLHVESNPLYLTGLGTRLLGNSIRFVPQWELIKAANSGIEQINYYRKNRDLSQISYRLIHSAPVDDFFYRDGLDEAQITASNADDGPWAPSKNGPVPQASCGAFYRSRLWLNDVDEPGKVFYSALARPEHFDTGLDFRRVESPSRAQVSGIFVQDQAILVGKADGIWTIVGDVNGPTNETIAKGAVAPNPTDVVAETRVRIGPVNEFGNGFVKVGAPGRIYFATLNGLYRWDGIDAVNVSDWITPTWQEMVQVHETLEPFPEGGGLAFTYGDDLGRQLLYVTLGTRFQEGRRANRPQMRAVVYHYGVNRGDGIGIWSTIDAGDAQPYSEPLDRNVGPYYLIPDCFATTPNGRVVMGSAAGLVTRLRDETLPRDAIPGHGAEWRFETGDITLLPGFESHVYGVKWLTAAPVRSPFGEVASMGVVCDGRETLAYLLMGANEFLYQRIGANCRRVRLFAASDGVSNTKYMRDNLILGWMLDVEPVGQR